jgi:hypothetical protein
VSYLIQNEIASSSTMLVRVAQAAAQENAPGDPDRWTYENRRDWAAAPGWSEAWESFLASHPPVEGETPDDPGADEGVITDGMILSQVQSMLAVEINPGE